MIETDILIIGAGPTGLFAVFEAGLLKLRMFRPFPAEEIAEALQVEDIRELIDFE